MKSKIKDLSWVILACVFVGIMPMVSALAATFQGPTITFQVDPGSATNVVVMPGTVAAIAGSSTTFSIQATDTHGCVIANPTPVTWWIVSMGGNGSINQSGACSHTTIGSYAVWAKYAGIQNSAVVTVSAGTISSTVSIVSAAPLSVTADGIATSTISMTAKDGGGNNIAGLAVTVAATGTGNVISNPAATDANGQTSCTIKSTVAEVKTITVTMNGIVMATHPTVTFTAGALDHIVMATVSSIQVAGTPFAISATAYDVNNNVADTYTAAATTSNTNGSISSGTAVSFINGVLSANVTVTRSAVSDKITVISGGKSAESNSFEMYAGVLASVVTWPDASVIQNVSDDTTLTCRVDHQYDALGNEGPWMTTHIVTWQLDSGSATLDTNTGVITFGPPAGTTVTIHPVINY